MRVLKMLSFFVSDHSVIANLWSEDLEDPFVRQFLHPTFLKQQNTAFAACGFFFKNTFSNDRNNKLLRAANLRLASEKRLNAVTRKTFKMAKDC